MKLGKEIINQHYVSQFYLENFTNIQGKNRRLNFFDKTTGKEGNADVTKMASEKFFNDTEEDFDQKVEKKLSLIEGKSKTALNHLIETKDISKISTEDRDTISFFVALQYLRTKEARLMEEDAVKQLADRLSNENVAPSLAKQIEHALTPEAVKRRHVAMYEDAETFAEIINSMKWILLVNSTKHPFWTSDNPVYVRNEIDLSPYGNLGLKCKGIELHFPLTPKLLLVACDPIEFRHEPDKKILDHEQYVIREQSYQVYSSTKFIFSNKPDFSFAKKVIEENPIHKDPDRKRVHVN